MNKNDLIGNITTIIKAISMIIAGYTVGIAISLGFQLPFTEAQIADAITTIIFIILAFLDAKYPNTFLDKQGSAKAPEITVNLDPNKLEEAIAKANDEVIAEEVLVEDDSQ